MVTHQVYMLDTTLFNRVLDGEIPLSSLASHRFIVTGIQRDELGRTTEPRRRAALLTIFEKIAPETVPASSFAFGIEGAGWDQAFHNDGSGTFERMRSRLQELDSKRKKKKKPLNQERDILIAETAVKMRVIVVSDDCNLRRVVAEFEGKAIRSAQLLNYEDPNDRD